MPLYERMVVIPEQEYKDLRTANAKFIDSVAGNVDGQVNHFELGENGRVTIKPNGGVIASNAKRKQRARQPDPPPPQPDVGGDEPQDGGDGEPEQAVPDSPVVPDIMSEPPSPSTSLPPPPRRAGSPTNASIAIGSDTPMSRFVDAGSGPDRPMWTKDVGIGTDQIAGVDVGVQSYNKPVVRSQESQTNIRPRVRNFGTQSLRTGRDFGVQAKINPHRQSSGIQADIRPMTRDEGIQTEEEGENRESEPADSPIITYPSDEEEEIMNLAGLPLPRPVQLPALMPPYDEDAIMNVVGPAAVTGPAELPALLPPDDGNWSEPEEEPVNDEKGKKRQRVKRFHRSVKKPKRRSTLAARATSTNLPHDPASTLEGLLKDHVSKISGDPSRVPIMRPTRSPQTRASIRKRKSKKDEQSTGLVVVRTPEEGEWEDIVDRTATKGSSSSNSNTERNMRQLVQDRVDSLSGKKKKSTGTYSVGKWKKGARQRRKKSSPAVPPSRPKLGKRKQDERREKDERYRFEEDEPPTKRRAVKTVLT